APFAIERDLALLRQTELVRLLLQLRFDIIQIEVLPRRALHNLSPGVFHLAFVQIKWGELYEQVERGYDQNEQQQRFEIKTTFAASFIQMTRHGLSPFQFCASNSRTAARMSCGGRSSRTITSPMRVGRMKGSLPCAAFLSCAIAATTSLTFRSPM